MAKPLGDIEHVVVLMLENRSFDNIFGGLYPELTKTGIFNGLTGNEWNYNPVSPGMGTWTVWQASPTAEVGYIPFPDPGEEFDQMNQQLFETPSPVQCPSPTMGGFAWDYALQKASRGIPGWPSVPPVPKNIMQYFDESMVKTSYALAKKHAVCDVWYAAAPVQTICNRTMTHTGTPSKVPGTNKARINNGDYTAGLSFKQIIEKGFNPPVTDMTIFEMLDTKYPSGKSSSCSDTSDPDKDRKLNWKIYYHDAPLSALCKYVYDRWCNTSYYGGNVFSFKEHFSSETNFEYDIKNGTLPTYSFIEPAYTSLDYTANSNHPGGALPDPLDFNAQNFPPPIDVANGEALLGKIYGILTKYPQVFKKTLLILTYDEYGGLYDHMKPKDAVSPFENPVDNFDFSRYGVRVPTILINPNITQGMIFRASDGQQQTGVCGTFETQLDHTSIIRTLCEQFDLGKPPTPRAATAATLSGLIPDGPEEEYIPLHHLIPDESQAEPRDLGKPSRIRAFIAGRVRDDLDGDSINNAVVATFVRAYTGYLRRSIYAVTDIVGIDTAAGEALAAMGVRDTVQLCRVLGEEGGLQLVARRTGAEAAQVLRWERNAALMKVAEVCGDDAYLLDAAGVQTPDALAEAKCEALQPRLQALLTRFGVEDAAVTQDTVAGWIAAAAP